MNGENFIANERDNILVKISIIIPIYDMVGSIEKCVTSITGNKNREIQIILVDDGSKDDSLSVCRDLAKLDDRIVVIHQDNQGSGPARNAGIKVASGEYFLFMDSDDFFDKESMDSLLDIIRHNNSDLIVFGYRILSPNNNIIEKRFNKRSLSGAEVRENYCPFFNNQFEWAIQGAPWNKLFKASIIRNNSIVFPSLRRHQDEVFISRFVENTSSIMFSDGVFYTHLANDVRQIWRKYPDNYFIVMSDLYRYRREIIEAWNPNNEEIKALTYSEYVNNTFRACFKLFDYENFCRYSERRSFYKKIKGSFIVNNPAYPHEYVRLVKRMQNKLFVFFLKTGCYLFLDCLVRLRLEVFKRS